MPPRRALDTAGDSPGFVVSDPTHIVVRNARSHNLVGVDCDVPRNQLVVFTGVSGSGKSSLVYDTIFKEGQRRFMESLSAYARQFLGQMERPDVDAVEGVSPTLSIDQKTVNRNPRSTVGTITEIFDHLRLLMARLGTPHCPVCDTEISRLGVEGIVEAILEVGQDRKVQLLAPVVKARKGEYRKEMAELARDGWVRARVDGELVRLDDPPELERYVKHTIEVVVDRIKPSASDRGRLAEAVETALHLGDRTVTVLIDDEERTYSADRACPNHPDQAVPELEPRLFSFNAPQGACPTCNGLGRLEAFEPRRLLDEDALLPEAYKAFNDSGKVPFSGLTKDILREVVAGLGADIDTPVRDWSPRDRDRLLYGDAAVHWSHVTAQGKRRIRAWQGLVPTVERVWHYTKFPSLQAFRSKTPCPDCGGARLNAIARSVRFRDQGIHVLSAMTVDEAHAFFADVDLEGEELVIGRILLQEIRDRLQFLVEVGLGYLSLGRSAATLSGGESQRIRLASQVGSGLQGVTYILDEPSIGLHPRDNSRLLQAIFRLRDRGNTLLVVEHDEETIRAADWVVDVGPGAGREGGEIVAEGPPGRVLRSERSLTAQYLRRDRVVEMPETRRSGSGEALVVRGARVNNLRDLDVRFPLGTLTVITGVSGSGKSSLTFQVLEPSLTKALQGEPIVGCRALDGLEHVDKIVRINQRPIGRTPRSNPATYTGAMDWIRSLFAQVPEAKARGYTKSRFSFNVKGGRCEDCQGAGVKTIEMQFLPDVEVPCETCGGKRYNRETLDVTFKGHTISDVLDLTIGEALELFQNQRKIARVLQTLVDVGLDYVPLGQSSTTLSGGEAQRVKLASELHRPSTGQTFYLLDEPTTGLHFEDVRKLMGAVQRLVDGGNTVVIVEHHTDVIKCADHVIDLGPEGGDAGGTLVGEGTPEAIAAMDTPTGRALAALPEFSGEAAPLAAEAPVRPEVRVAHPKGITVEGARKHNLRAIDVTIPHTTLSVITGPSGSGKTSLAFDTIFAEGQRRYVESLSTYARRFLGRLDRAPLDRIEGLQPAIAIDQGSSSHNPRSTVATVTEVHDVLRLLYARVGTAHCPHCERVLAASSPSTVARRLAAADSGAGWLTTFLPPDDDPEERRDLLARDAWQRLLVPDGDDVRELRLEDDAAIAELQRGAELVIDRLNPARARSRVAEAAASAYHLGHGRLWFRPRGEGEVLAFTEGLHCPEHGPILGELTPRHFSFNSRLGMCTRCEGLGTVKQVVPEGLFQGGGPFDRALDPKVGAVLMRSKALMEQLDAVFAVRGLSKKDPVSSWDADTLALVLHGSPDPLVPPSGDPVVWPGLLTILKTEHVRLTWVQQEVPCPSCRGGRLRPEVLAVTLEGLGIDDFARLTVEESLAAVRSWALEGERATIAERPALELERRLGFLVDVGLGYLALDRIARTLSGGEGQRIRLASQLGSQLVGVTYVLDEPTIGLHPRDTDRLLGTLEELRDLGNTVLVVEHDPDTIARADHVVDLGPAAGRYGGRVVASGTPAEIAANPESVTGRWMSGAERVPRRDTRRVPSGRIVLEGPRTNNLRLDRAVFPTGAWTAITGVSGSGKSSLVMDTLAPAVQREIGLDARPGPYDTLSITKPVDGVVLVDQSPLGRTPRSTPATYVGVMDKLRALYAEAAGSRERGWTKSRFSFNTPGGRCEHCEGRGATLIEMHFLPDVWITCPECRGRRYNRETLAVRWNGLTIADALALRADEALEHFQHHRGLKRALQALVDVGLGYVQLGQPATQLSGGEAQRVKLASELMARRGHRLYVLDEPTTGLHMTDVARLVTVLHRLVDKGHTVLTIEHHLDMIGQADHVIELGPEGGKDGGCLVAEGTPDEVATLDTPTGVALRAWRERLAG